MRIGAFPFAVMATSGTSCSCLSAPRIAPRAELIRSEPVIVTIDDLLSPEEVSNIRRQLAAFDLVPTSDYQEDVFASGAEAEEDAHFRRAVKTSGASVPEPYAKDPLQSFVWAVTNAPGAMAEEDVVRGANAILRRKAAERWKSEEGRALMELSADDSPFERSGRRFRMAGSARSTFEEEIVPRVLSTDPGAVEWTVRDATVVSYREGESQVPHIDPCDATLLLYLGSGIAAFKDDGGEAALDCVGGDTCFPLVDCRIAPEQGRGLLFFSSSVAEGIVRNRETFSLHHGGQVVLGQKLVAQLMLDADLKRPIDSWANLVSCLQ